MAVSAVSAVLAAAAAAAAAAVVCSKRSEARRCHGRVRDHALQYRRFGLQRRDAEVDGEAAGDKMGAGGVGGVGGVGSRGGVVGDRHPGSVRRRARRRVVTTEIERCVSVAPDGVDAFLLVFSAAGQSPPGDRQWMPSSRDRRQGVPRPRSGCLHSRRQLDANRCTLTEYLEDAPPALTDLAACRGPLLCDNRAPGVAVPVEFLTSLSRELQTVEDAFTTTQGPVTSEHVAVAAKAREPRLGLKARRRLRQQEAARRHRAERGAGGEWVGLGGAFFGLFGAVAQIVCPPPGPKKATNRPPECEL